MKQTDLARGMGVTQGLVSRWVKRGMPTSSVEEAQRWREGNTDSSKSHDPIESVAPPESINANALKHVEQMTAESKKPGTLEEAEEYIADLSNMRRFAKGAAATLYKSGRVEDARKWVNIHQSIARQYPALHKQVLDLRERHRINITTVDAEATFCGYLTRLRGLIDSMPGALAAKVNPSDPDHAREQLERWRDESLFKTLSTAPSVLP